MPPGTPPTHTLCIHSPRGLPPPSLPIGAFRVTATHLWPPLLYSPPTSPPQGHQQTSETLLPWPLTLNPWPAFLLPPTQGPYSTLSLLASGSQDPHPCSASPGLLSQPQTSTAPGQAQRPRRPRASKQSLPCPQHCALSPSQRLQSEQTPFSPLTSTPHTRAPALPS